MNSILNSISQGDLQVQEPRDTPIIKEDSIVDLLQEIEFDVPEKKEPPKQEIIIEFEEKQEEPPKQEIIIDLDVCPHPEHDETDFNTGFGANQDLHYESKCELPKLKVPLYKENYLGEFLSENEKALARRSLGLFNKEDIVAMSLLTAKDDYPSKEDWDNVTTKQLRKGDKFFTPITQTKAVIDANGVALDLLLSEINTAITYNQESLKTMLEASPKGSDITSLGDVRQFLNGFSNDESLHEIIGEMNKEMLRFENTGII